MLKNFLLLLLVAVCSAAFAVPNPDPGKPAMPSLKAQRDLLNQGYGAKALLGNQVVDHKVQLAKGTWSVVRNGGASVVLPSTILANLADVDGKDLQLPYHALIKNIFFDVITPLAASSDPRFSAAQLGLGLDNPGDLKGYAAASSYTGFLAGNPVGTAATLRKVGSVVGASRLGSTVKLNMRGGSVVAGQMNVFIEYYLSD